MLYGNISFSCVLPHKSGDDLEFGAEEMRKRTTGSTAIAINSFQITTQCDFKQFSEGHIHLMQVLLSICTLLFCMAHSVFN